MIYLAIFIVFTFTASMVQAQTNNPSIYTYKQKRLNDTLKMLFPDLQTSKDITYHNDMPVLPLKNEGIKVSSNSRGDVYSMQTDNMPCLKPFKTKDEIPNPAAPKQLTPVLPKGEH
jgi:hypothetical protein